LLILIAKLQQRNPKILPLISTLPYVHLSPLSLSLSHCTGLSRQTKCHLLLKNPCTSLIGFFAQRVEIKEDSRQCAVGREKKEKK
jgi:hypothetical protein